MALTHRSPWELLVATILSAQCTDARVNAVTPGLFARYPAVDDMTGAVRHELESIIRPTGFFKSKARYLVACARAVASRYGGQVPQTMDELITLPGVGRKTANVVLGNGFGQAAVIVDTHVRRVCLRLGLVSTSDPDRIERALQVLMPRGLWTAGSQHLLLHGRYVCRARSPQCGECAIVRECHWEGKRTP